MQTVNGGYSPSLREGSKEKGVAATEACNQAALTEPRKYLPFNHWSTAFIHFLFSAEGGVFSVEEHLNNF